MTYRCPLCGDIWNDETLYPIGDIMRKYYFTDCPSCRRTFDLEDLEPEDNSIEAIFPEPNK